MKSLFELGIINYTAQYPGWRGMIYDEARYVYRGKFATTRCERFCLAEYAEVFKTGCVGAVKESQPHDQTKEVNAEARQAGRALIGEGTKSPKRKTLIFVNNRLAGNLGYQQCFA